MVTFNDILAAFNEYKRHECKQTWDVLWLASNECMTALLRRDFSNRKIQADERVLIVDSAIANIMDRFKNARYADIAWVESRFANEKKSVLTMQTWEQKRESVVKCLDDEESALVVNIIQKPCHKDDFF